MPKTLRLVHDEHFSMIDPKDAPEGSVSEGTRTVLTSNGEEDREKHRVSSPDNHTDVELPDDYDVNDMQALVHLVQTLKDSHSDKFTSVTGSDAALTGKVAALLGVSVGAAPAAEPAPVEV